MGKLSCSGEPDRGWLGRRSNTVPLARHRFLMWERTEQRLRTCPDTLKQQLHPDRPLSPPGSIPGARTDRHLSAPHGESTAALRTHAWPATPSTPGTFETITHSLPFLVTTSTTARLSRTVAHCTPPCVARTGVPAASRAGPWYTPVPLTRSVPCPRPKGRGTDLPPVKQTLPGSLRNRERATQPVIRPASTWTVSATATRSHGPCRSSSQTMSPSAGRSNSIFTCAPWFGSERNTTQRCPRVSQYAPLHWGGSSAAGWSGSGSMVIEEHARRSPRMTTPPPKSASTTASFPTALTRWSRAHSASRTTPSAADADAVGR